MLTTVLMLLAIAVSALWISSHQRVDSIALAQNTWRIPDYLDTRGFDIRMIRGVWVISRIDDHAFPYRASPGRCPECGTLKMGDRNGGAGV